MCDCVLLEEHKIDRRTPCGVWIQDPWAYPVKLRFVNLTKVKQYACETKDAAKVSFLARKKRQLAILRSRIAMIEGAVERIESDEIGEHYSSFDL
jgi:hypothetical protein